MNRLFLRESLARLIAFAVIALLILAAIPSNGFAQTPSNPAPYNIDLGVQITNTARPAGTVTTSPINNTNWKGVVCTMLQSAISGSPSTTFSIQGFDAATASWNTLVTSTALTTSTSEIHSAYVYPGMVAADVPTNGAAKGISLPRTWRLSQTVGGTGGPTTTSKIGCNSLL